MDYKFYELMIQTKDSNPAPKSVDANFEMSYYAV